MKPELLDGIALTVPADALEHFEAALGAVCLAVSFFHDEANDLWDLHGVKERGASEPELTAALALAELLTGCSPPLTRGPVAAGGWLARTQAAFPEQQIGRRFVIRGTHIVAPPAAGRITLVLDAGLAFGSGEHHSTRGCLRALERMAHRRPARILDLGTGSGILAIAATKLGYSPVRAMDFDPDAVRVARANARANRVQQKLKIRRGDVTRLPIRPGHRRRQYDLVCANLISPLLIAERRRITGQLKPTGTLVLAGILKSEFVEVQKAYTALGWKLASHRDEKEWRSGSFRFER